LEQGSLFPSSPAEASEGISGNEVWPFAIGGVEKVEEIVCICIAVRHRLQIPLRSRNAKIEVWS